MMRKLFCTSVFAFAALTVSACGSESKKSEADDRSADVGIEAQDATTTADETIEFDEAGNALAKKKAAPKPKKPPLPLWRCVAVGVNFFDGMRYAGDGQTRTQANNKAVATCQASGPKRKCAVISSPLPGLFVAGGCARLR